MKHCESVASLEKKLSRVVVDLVTDLNLGIKKKKSKWVLVFIVLFCFPQCGLLYFWCLSWILVISQLCYGDGFQLSKLNGIFFEFS